MFNDDDPTNDFRDMTLEATLALMVDGTLIPNEDSFTEAAHPVWATI